MMNKLKVEIIAEVGSNHDGSLEAALRYVDAAANSGADIVKFQSIRKDRLWARMIREGGKNVPNPAWEKVKNISFPEEWHFELKKRADAAGIEFMSTPFYLEAVDLMESAGVRRYKIASGDITFFALIEKIGRTGKPVFLATGASDTGDVRKAVELLKKSGTRDITLLHCVSNYPPAWEEMNLQSIVTLKNEFGMKEGLSDHSPGIIAPVAAVALGATAIEKHVTFDRGLPGPDHPYATTMEELAELVDAVRKTEKALGDGSKKPSEAEQLKQFRIRRGLYHPDTGEPYDGKGSVWLRPEWR